MGNVGTPAAEVVLDVRRVQALVRAQHPDLADLSLTLLDSGWDNELYRLGSELVVRLPRRAVSAELVKNEQRWLPTLATQLSIPVPVPVRTGMPDEQYPFPWSIQRWFDGVTADSVILADGEASRMGRFLGELHQPAPREAPVNEVRGVPLSLRAANVEGRIGRVAAATELVTEPVLGTWRRALDAPVHLETCWLHGDLHPRNIVVHESRLAAIIDWGDMTGGDAATDLASLWMLFDAPERRAALEAYGALREVTPDLIARSRGWAFLFGMVLTDSGLIDHPAHLSIGTKTLRRLATDEQP